MNIDDLKKSAEKITLPDDAKERIIQKCAELAETEKTGSKSVTGNDEYTDHVFTVEHYKPRRFSKIAASIAACAVIAASAGLTMKLVKNQPKSASSPSSITAADTTSALNDNIPEELTKVLNNDFTSFLGSYLSGYQRDKIRELFSNAEYSLADEFKDEDADFIEYTDSEFTYRVGVYKDLICYRCDSIDDTEFAKLKGYFISNDIEGNTHTKEITAVADEPGLKYRNYFRVSKDFSEEFRAILNMPFEQVLGENFFITEPGDLSSAQQDEIRDFLRGVNAETMISKHYIDQTTLPDLNSASAALNYKDNDAEYRIYVYGSFIKYYCTGVLNSTGEKTVYEGQYTISTNEDAAAKILDIYMQSSDKKIQEEAEKLKEAYNSDEARKKAEEEEKELTELIKQNEAEEEASRYDQSTSLDTKDWFNDDIHIGWFPYNDDVGRGVSDDARKQLEITLGDLRVTPDDISKLEENSDKAVVVYGSRIDTTGSWSVVIFGDHIVVTTNEVKDQCFKTDNAYLYEDVMAYLTSESKENLLAPFYPPAGATYEYSGTSAKTLPLDKLNEVAQEINNNKWSPVSTYENTQDALHIVVNYKNEIQDKTLHIYLKDEYIYIAERDNNANTEQQKAASVYSCNDKGLADKIKAMLEE
jgi:hypothetical protein